MDPKRLRDNTELLCYLTELSNELESGGEKHLAQDVKEAARFAIGSASEFLHEAQVALQRVERLRPKSLSSNRLEELSAVIAQIRGAFDRIGGA